jgi:hypothetical protein
MYNQVTSDVELWLFSEGTELRMIRKDCLEFFIYPQPGRCSGWGFFLIGGTL